MTTTSPSHQPFGWATGRRGTYLVDSGELARRNPRRFAIIVTVDGDADDDFADDVLDRVALDLVEDFEEVTTVEMHEVHGFVL